MSVTITLGGVTMTGAGVTFVAPPPSQATAGWFAGGYVSAIPYPNRQISTVQRITFATDTATATIRGPLSSGRKQSAGLSTFTYGWFGGGYTNAGTIVSSIDRVTFATDTDTASSRGPLAVSTGSMAGVSDGTTYGWFGGGGDGAGGLYSNVQRITFATDTATASQRGKLFPPTGRGMGGTSDNTTYGWFAGGTSPTSSAVNRIIFATDTSTATLRGPLSAAKYAMGSVGTTTDGWFAGGAPGSSIVQRITYATDTVTASVRGPLTANKYMTAGVANITYGWFGGNITASSTVDRIIFATDTATATNRGPLATASGYMGSASGQQ